MAKGVSIKFKTYQETIPKLLSLLKLDLELKKHSSIVLKPYLSSSDSSTSDVFVESVLKFCLEHKKTDAKIFIAEGADGADTLELSEKQGYKRIAEQYGISLIDLNTSEVEEIRDDNFLKFESIYYPKILTESFVISLPKLAEDSELEVISSLSNMIGAFPAHHYQGFFASKKNKIRKWPIKYSIHDILCCKLPELAIIDASAQGYILAGKPLEIDKQAAKLIKGDWRSVSFLKLIEESLAKSLEERATRAEKAEKERKAK